MTRVLVDPQRKFEDWMTPRQLADRCCGFCRSLPGNGPWCGRCGREMPNSVTDSTWFAADVCAQCHARMWLDSLDPPTGWRSPEPGTHESDHGATFWTRVITGDGLHPFSDYERAAAWSRVNKETR